MSKVNRLPLQRLVLQITSHSERPVHLLPPLDAGIFMALVFDRFPPPQLFEQDVHSSQSVHTQSTVIREYETDYCKNTVKQNKSLKLFLSLYEASYLDILAIRMLHFAPCH